MTDGNDGEGRLTGTRHLVVDCVQESGLGLIPVVPIVSVYASTR